MIKFSIAFVAAALFAGAVLFLDESTLFWPANAANRFPGVTPA
jgi:hypothetical protein